MIHILSQCDPVCAIGHSEIGRTYEPMDVLEPIEWIIENKCESLKQLLGL